MKARKRFLNFLLKFSFLFFFSLQICSEFVIDGYLSEKEWEVAREIDKFYEVFPFSLNDASGDTRILIQEDKKGIYIGFINNQKTN